MKTKTEQASAYWPIPWTLRANTDGSATADIFDANECGITTLDIRLAPKVVQAVNNHSELVIVCRALLGCLPYGNEALQLRAEKVLRDSE